MVLVVKNLPASEGGIRDVGSIPGLGRSPGGGHDNPFQYTFLENPMDRGAWQATVRGSQRVEWDMTEGFSMQAGFNGVMNKDWLIVLAQW